jgi:signal transduction histidine kinase
MIDTIVTNLVDNALKYTKANAIILVEVNDDNGGWSIQISDNGVGIAPEYLPNIFDKFYRVPSGDLHDVKGYGLGLSYVKELVTLLKGTIKVSSSKGTGTVFTIQFTANE